MAPAVTARTGPTVRTLWLTNDLPPRAGGIEQFLANLLVRLDPDATLVLAADAPGAAAHDRGLPYRVVRIAPRPLLPTGALAARVRHAAAEHGADVVVLGALWPLGEIARNLDRPVLALTHGHEAGMARVGLGPLVRRAARDVRALTTISGFTRRALQPWIPDDVLVEHLPPGVDVDAFHPAVDGTPIRDRHGIGSDEPLVVCVSRLVARKGQDVLVEAWPDVRRRVPGARLILGGAGPAERRLRRRAAALGIDAAVTFTGVVSWHELPAHHAAADVFAMPCRTRLGGLDVEGLGIVYLEAQACGRPVVAGRSGGAPEAIVDGETGVVVDGRDVDDVARVLADLLLDDGRRAALGAAGRRHVVANAAWPVLVGRLHGLLERVAGGP